MAIREVFARDGYNYDVDLASREAALVCPEVTKTQQSGKEEADINTLVRRFGLTGQMPISARPVTYVDFDEVFDYQTAQNALISADRAFMAMPAEVRSRFGNNPQEFVLFCSNPANLDEMRKLGLAVPKEEAENPPAGDPPA